MNAFVNQCAWVAVALSIASLSHGAEPPALLNLRYEEDAAAYREIPASGALAEAKYIPLGDSSDSFLSLGGQGRVRWENWNNFGFGPANDDDFGLLRLRVHGDLHLGPAFRVFVEGKSATATDRDLPGGRRTLDVDELDLQNAFVDVKQELRDWTATLRLGRQELSYGAQRLVSPLDWSNTRRTFDGVRAIAQHQGWRIDAFATRPVTLEKYEFNEPDDDQAFYGLYAVHAVPGRKLVYDLYLLRLDRDALASGDEERSTAGVRLNGTCPLTGVEFDAEGGWQFGDAGDRDIEAWFGAVEAGYTLAEVAMKPRLYLGYDYASGDSDAGDDKVETFHQLFPLGHAYFGYADVLGRQNVTDFSQGISCWPVEKKVQLRLDHHLFHRAETADAAYNVGGGVLREADAGTSSEIGSELDVTATYKYSRNVLLAAGYSRFFAGDFIEESGPSEDIDFAYVSAQYTF